MRTVPTTPLSSLVTIVGGGTPSKARPEFFEGTIPWVTPKDIKVWTILDSEDHISEEAVDASSAKLVPKGTVLVVVRSGVLKHTLPVAIAGRPVTMNQDMKGLLCGDDIDPRFLAFFLKSAEPQLLTTVRGTTADNIPLDALKALEVPRLPLSEQRRIADLLDKADAIRRKRKEAIALTEELLRSAFLEMFGDPVTNPKGWPVRALGELLDAIDSGWSPVCEARPPKDDEWGVLKLGAVTFGRYDEHETKALAADLSPVPEIEVRAGDVLFSRKNTYEHVAACVFVTNTRPKLMLPDLIFRLVLSTTSGLRPETLWAMLSNERMRRTVQGLAGGTAGSMPNISKDRLKTVHIPVPPIALQARFAEVVTRNESIRAAREAAATESDVLFNSLVARAFSAPQEATR